MTWTQRTVRTPLTYRMVLTQDARPFSPSNYDFNYADIPDSLRGGAEWEAAALLGGHFALNSLNTSRNFPRIVYYRLPALPPARSAPRRLVTPDSVDHCCVAGVLHTFPTHYGRTQFLNGHALRAAIPRCAAHWLAPPRLPPAALFLVRHTCPTCYILNLCYPACTPRNAIAPITWLLRSTSLPVPTALLCRHVRGCHIRPCYLRCRHLLPYLP